MIDEIDIIIKRKNNITVILKLNESLNQNNIIYNHLFLRISFVKLFKKFKIQRFKNIPVLRATHKIIRNIYIFCASYFCEWHPVDAVKWGGTFHRNEPSEGGKREKCNIYRIHIYIHLSNQRRACLVWDFPQQDGLSVSSRQYYLRRVPKIFIINQVHGRAFFYNYDRTLRDFDSIPHFRNSIKVKS